jgi:hypothetical protein
MMVMMSILQHAVVAGDKSSVFSQNVKTLDSIQVRCGFAALPRDNGVRATLSCDGTNRRLECGAMQRIIDGYNKSAAADLKLVSARIDGSTNVLTRFELIKVGCCCVRPTPVVVTVADGVS